MVASREVPIGTMPGGHVTRGIDTTHAKYHFDHEAEGTVVSWTNPIMQKEAY